MTYEYVLLKLFTSDTKAYVSLVTNHLTAGCIKHTFIESNHTKYSVTRGSTMTNKEI